MPTQNLEYLDESGLNRTAANVLAKIIETKEQIDAELDNLDYAQPDGIYPDMTVGAVIGADETVQWAQRESTGSGSATVRSVQGNAQKLTQLIDPSCEYASKTRVGVTSEGQTTTVHPTSNNTTALKHAEIDVPAGHVVLLIGRYTIPEGANIAYGVYSGVNESLYDTRVILTAGTTRDVAAILTATGEYTNIRFINFSTAMTSSVYVNIDNLQVFDLTDMYGAGNEPSTVEAFRADYPFAYYPRALGELVPVRIAGIASTDAQGGELDAIEWPTQELWGAGIYGDVLYADRKETRVGVVDLGTLTWVKGNALTDGTGTVFRTTGFVTGVDNLILTDIQCAVDPPFVAHTIVLTWERISLGQIFARTDSIIAGGDSSLTAAQFKASVSGVKFYYPLKADAITTTPISPALPMTYRVQAGGSESIIVPAGEISAAPIVTIAEPVNMSTELALIWAAIEALQGSRQSLQPDVRNDLQEITADLTPIDVTKEVQQTDEDREVSE